MTYFELANEYYKHIDHEFKSACEINWFNVFVPECAQIVEMYMKALLELRELPKDVSLKIFGTHNLMQFGRVINRLYPNTINEEKAAWLSYFYFDAHYPGDNCFIVSEYDAERALKATKALVDPLIVLFKSLSTRDTNFFGESEWAITLPLHL